MRVEERRSFALRTGLEDDQVVPHDLLEGPPTLRQVRRYDALTVGGSGDFYVSREDLPEFPALMELFCQVVDLPHPTFASCFGFQCLVKALGGEIIHDPERTEVGTYEVTLTSAGRDDPLFGLLPTRFPAQMGHKDRAATLPPGIVNLASSSLCEYQAFCIPGKPIWATQFHPELDDKTNRSRFHRYLDGYASQMSAEEREAALSRFGDAPDTLKLLSQFLKLVLDA